MRPSLQLRQSIRILWFDACVRPLTASRRSSGKVFCRWDKRLRHSTLNRKRPSHMLASGLSKERSADTARELNDPENRASRNSPSLAVALNCGMGSSSLKAEVNAFERGPHA
jgi:hypothetical protein